MKEAKSISYLVLCFYVCQALFCMSGERFGKSDFRGVLTGGERCGISTGRGKREQGIAEFSLSAVANV